jgi:endonuclease YncB( thermonuclease family)
LGKPVTLAILDRDSRGRWVAVVQLADGTNVNHELVKAGAAWWYREYAPQDEMLADLEAKARQAKRGLWTNPEAVPPWAWRRGVRLR